MMLKKNPHVGLFVTCLVDLFRPQIAFASIKLLENAGCRVTVPVRQTCCGQPAYNNGDRTDTKIIASQVIDTFSHFDYVVVPSGSCAGMLHKHYPALFNDEPTQLARANDLATRTYEITAFLSDVLGLDRVNASYPHTVTYHDACSGLRELNVKQQPRKLLNSVKGITLQELPDNDVCCGFGGTFCVKYAEISNKMATDKIAHIQSTEADTLLAGDLGCLMHIAGKLQRSGCATKVLHVTEVLADLANQSGIGEPDKNDILCK